MSTRRLREADTAREVLEQGCVMQTPARGTRTGVRVKETPVGRGRSSVNNIERHSVGCGAGSDVLDWTLSRGAPAAVIGHRVRRRRARASALLTACFRGDGRGARTPST